ncbi:hypothetical protein WG904_12940 [Pedobacter sp. Du54]|uniref:hypothetical protein n=1 Tax=Pedobacter anseongensis TaxID=3133439 RepID=UPI0030B0DB10
MNDPLKKYVQEHRDDFDTLEPSADILFKLKKELNQGPKEKTGMMRLIVNQKWLVAASVLLILSITYYFITNDNHQSIKTPQIVKNVTPNRSEAVINEAVEMNKITPKIAVKKHKKQPKGIDMLSAYHDLTDSTSASTRLAAILKIQKSNKISYDVIDKMTATLNHDSNSNVRLAALNLMSKYAHDSYVNNAFMLSLSNQKDPLLQLGLMELLKQTDNPKLDDKLYALATDPTTLSEVKDQAYFILLNQNKL